MLKTVQILLREKNNYYGNVEVKTLRKKIRQIHMIKKSIFYNKKRS